MAIGDLLGETDRDGRKPIDFLVDTSISTQTNLKRTMDTRTYQASQDTSESGPRLRKTIPPPEFGEKAFLTEKRRPQGSKERIGAVGP